jgi:hypothetical protein
MGTVKTALVTPPVVESATGFRAVPLTVRVTAPEGGTLPAGGPLAAMPRVTVTEMLVPSAGEVVEGVMVRVVGLRAAVTVNR